MKLQKKLISLLLITLITLTLVVAGCTESKTTPPSNPPKEKTQPAPEIPSEPEPEPDSDAISWDKASDYIGDEVTIYGPVIDTKYASSSNGQPTFLNLGKAYPDPDRFTIVIWGENRSNFDEAPEDYYLSKTIYVTGLVDEYQGIPQIEVESPDQIEEK